MPENSHHAVSWLEVSPCCAVAPLRACTWIFSCSNSTKSASHGVLGHLAPVRRLLRQGGRERPLLGQELFQQGSLRLAALQLREGDRLGIRLFMARSRHPTPWALEVYCGSQRSMSCFKASSGSKSGALMHAISCSSAAKSKTPILSAHRTALKRPRHSALSSSEWISWR